MDLKNNSKIALNTAKKSLIINALKKTLSEELFNSIKSVKLSLGEKKVSIKVSSPTISYILKTQKNSLLEEINKMIVKVFGNESFFEDLNFFV